MLATFVAATISQFLLNLTHDIAQHLLSIPRSFSLIFLYCVCLQNVLRGPFQNTLVNPLPLCVAFKESQKSVKDEAVTQ
jgi:hypothetical protein